MVQKPFLWTLLVALVLAGLANPGGASTQAGPFSNCPDLVDPGVPDPRCCEVDGPDGECTFRCIAHGGVTDPPTYEPFGVFVIGEGFFVTVVASCESIEVARCSTPPDPCTATGDGWLGVGTCRVTGIGTGACGSYLKPIPI